MEYIKEFGKVKWAKKLVKVFDGERTYLRVNVNDDVCIRMWELKDGLTKLRILNKCHSTDTTLTLDELRCMRTALNEMVSLIEEESIGIVEPLKPQPRNDEPHFYTTIITSDKLDRDEVEKKLLGR